MAESDRCDLHEVAVRIGSDESEAFTSLRRSPLGDDCQHCHVCRAARTYVERRLGELERPGATTGAAREAAWRELQSAVVAARSAIRPPPHAP